MSLDFTEKLVKDALKMGADDAAVELSDEKVTQVRFANNEISVNQNWHQAVASIFLAIGKKVKTITLDDLTPRTIEKQLNLAIASARSSSQNENYKGLAKGPFKYISPMKFYDRHIGELGEKLVDYAYAAINATNAKRAAGVVYTTVGERFLSTSNSVNTSEKYSQIEASVRAFNEKDESGHGVSCSNMLNKFSPEAAGKHAGEIAKLAKKPESANQGCFDVIFHPLAFSALLSTTAQTASAFMVDSGFSFLGGKIGKKIANYRVTLYDDSSMENGLNSSAFDDEGVPTQKTCIIKDGVLQTYLHNTSTAMKYSTKTTGNAGIISPYPRNVVLEPGTHEKNDLFSQVKNGIYITNVWYTRFQNYKEGTFSTIPRDGIFLIQNGSIIRSLKGIRVSDNMLNILQNIAAIGKERQWIHWWEVDTPCYTPYVLVKNVNITKSVM